eukprot:2513263-Pleurochrysis_carterae.AAC.1
MSLIIWGKRMRKHAVTRGRASAGSDSKRYLRPGYVYGLSSVRENMHACSWKQILYIWICETLCVAAWT